MASVSPRASANDTRRKIHRPPSATPAPSTSITAPASGMTPPQQHGEHRRTEEGGADAERDFGRRRRTGYIIDQQEIKRAERRGSREEHLMVRPHRHPCGMRDDETNPADDARDR